MTFKDSVFGMTEQEFAGVYQRTADTHSLQGETDLNAECLDRLLADITNTDVLDVGCGRGFLADRLSRSNQVRACDIMLTDGLSTTYPKVRFEANIEALPFEDGQFDTVVCTHTVEHVQDLSKALSELRRVARNHLYIIVPRQRPDKYTFSLHTQFFPYQWSIESGFGFRKGARIDRLGDWYYYEPVFDPK